MLSCNRLTECASIRMYMERLEDIDYIEKVLAGDAECFAPLLERYKRPVFSLLVKMVGSREDAEELAQDVFMKAFRSLASFHRDSGFSTWLYRIAYNTAISFVRKTKHEWLSFDDNGMERVAAETTDEETDTYSGEERLQHLERALEQLPSDERALILLFYKQEKKVEEIATITGLTESNVKVKMHRIRKKLMVFIKEIKD